MNKKLLRYICSSAVTQSKVNKKKSWKKLPPDQEAILNELLKGIDDAAKIYSKNIDKIQPQYKSQMIDAMILKAASAFDWNGNSK